MKNIVLIILSVIFLSSCAVQKIELANGKKVSKKEYQKMLDKAWDESFGRMTNDEKDLLYSTPIIIDTMNVVPDTIK
jgi:hypothetical protein